MLTLSKKQRPTSSGQSVYASSSFRNVLQGKQCQAHFQSVNITILNADVTCELLNEAHLL